ncbi:MAG: HEPN domain-containing protein [bacterium]|nr:HEPN domain-containing protein [bacterium]
MSYKPITSPAPSHLLSEAVLTELIIALRPLFVFWGEFAVNPDFHILTIIVEEGECKPSTFDKAETLLEGQPQLRHRIYTQGYATEQIEAGNLFFIENLLLGSMVYQQPELEFPFMTPALGLSELITTSQLTFEKEMQKIVGFYEGAITHFEKGQYAQCTFAYHQTMELLFRAAENALMGRNKITHRLREHQEYCYGFLPSLASFFDPNDSKEAAALEILDKAYCAARYGKDFEPTGEDIDIVYYKVEQLHVLTSILFYSTWQRCSLLSYKKNSADEAVEEVESATEETLLTSLEKGIVPQQTDTKVTETDLVKSGHYETEDEFLVRVIELLKTKFDLDSVFLISKYEEQQTLEVNLEQDIPLAKTTIIYTLLLVTTEISPLSHSTISDFIAKETEDSCKVYAILYNFDEVFAKRDYGSHFLEFIITQSHWAYYASQKNYGPNFQVNYHPTMVRNIEKIWENKSSKAAYLLDLLENDGFSPYDFTVTLMIVRLAIEQVCLGMIQVFWEYKPKQYSLPYLLHLCSHFSKAPTAIFHKSTYENQRMYHLICSAKRILRNNKNQQVNLNDSETAICIGEEFVRKAREDVSEHLKDLKVFAEEYKKQFNMV